MRSFTTNSSLILTCLLLFLATGPLHAQEFIPPPDTYALPCDDPEPPTGPLGIPCVLANTITGFEEIFDVVVTSTTKKGSWAPSLPCDPRYAPCSSIIACLPGHYTHGTEHQVCWSVGLGASVQAKTTLVTSLFAELSVTLSVNVVLTNCHTWSQSYTYYSQPSQCYTTFVRPVWIESVATGKLRRASEAYDWVCATSEGREFHRTYCNESVVIDGRVTKTDGQSHEYAPHPEDCGGILFNPDPYDGQRRIPACRPMFDCDVIPPPGLPCCGCYTTS